MKMNKKSKIIFNGLDTFILLNTNLMIIIIKTLPMP